MSASAQMESAIKMDDKMKSYTIVGIWAGYVILLLIFYKSLVDAIITSGFAVGALLYLLTNPAYLLLIYFIVSNAQRKSRSAIKAAISSLLIVFAFDMASSPRVLINELFTTGASTITNMGSIAITAMANTGIPPTIAWYLYYLILPILFMIIALENLGAINFVKNIKKGGM